MTCPTTAKPMPSNDPSQTDQSTSFPWPEGKRAALSLSFDDARPTQLDTGLPILDRHGVRATFYVLQKRYKDRLDQWKEVAANGHEIGNHTVNHRCSNKVMNQGAKALEYATLEEIEREILDQSDEIEKDFGTRPATFAYPCGNTFVGFGENHRSYVHLIAKYFEVGRGFPSPGPNDPFIGDLAAAPSAGFDQMPHKRFHELMDQTLDKGGWLILTGHEVQADRFQAVPPDLLETICTYCNDPANGVWLDTVANVGSYIHHHRTADPAVPQRA